MLKNWEKLREAAHNQIIVGGKTQETNQQDKSYSIKKLSENQGTMMSSPIQIQKEKTAALETNTAVGKTAAFEEMKSSPVKEVRFEIITLDTLTDDLDEPLGQLRESNEENKEEVLFIARKVKIVDKVSYIVLAL